ncbi:MAG: hypothetical protein LC104_03415 [Bacteroidales bacterium]|nr:hypothetical protein [Bacteroidales bacterium]
MASTEQVLQPVAVALHTRDREEDYHWYPETGTPVLTRKLRDLHRGLLADLDAKPASPATFLLLDEGDRIGLLIGNLKTCRSDHLNTRFDDTLLLEFDSGRRSEVYLLAAGLLGPSSSQIQQQFLAYAEDRFQQRDANPVPAIRVPLLAKRGGSDDLPAHRHAALRANEANCRRVATLLEVAADDPAYLGRGVLIVSTGYVGKDKLQQFTPQVQRLIALSRASSIPEADAVALTSVGEKKKTSRLLATAGAALVLACSLLWISWATFFATRSSPDSASKSNGSNNGSSDSKAKTSSSGNGFASSKEKANGKSGSELQRGVSLAAGIVGVGAALHGQGGLAVAVCIATEAGAGPRPVE